MANEDDVWKYKDADGDKLEVTQFTENVQFCGYCPHDDMKVIVAIPLRKIRELRDFLTAKLEGDDGRD